MQKPRCFTLQHAERIGNFTVLRCRDPVENKLTLPYYDAETTLFYSATRRENWKLYRTTMQRSSRKQVNATVLRCRNHAVLLCNTQRELETLPYYDAETTLLYSATRRENWKLYRTTMQRFSRKQVNANVLRCRKRAVLLHGHAEN